jgi:hypothetical protein
MSRNSVIGASRFSSVLRQPVEHGLRVALELHVAVPSRVRALDPLPLLLGQNVVEHRLDRSVRTSPRTWQRKVGTRTLLVHSCGTRCSSPTLVRKRRRVVEVVDATAEAHHGEAAFSYVPGGDRLFLNEERSTTVTRGAIWAPSTPDRPLPASPGRGFPAMAGLSMPGRLQAFPANHNVFLHAIRGSRSPARENLSRGQWRISPGPVADPPFVVNFLNAVSCISPTRAGKIKARIATRTWRRDRAPGAPLETAT